MAPGKPPSTYPWLTPDLYKKTHRRAYLYALKLKHRPAEAEDFVTAAITKALDPEGSPWTPGMTPDFASHVCNLLYSAHGNHVQSYAVLHVRASLDDPDRAPIPHHGDVGEEALDQTRADRLAEKRMTRLSERVVGDALVVLLLDSDDDDKTSTERALEAGYSLDDVELARARLKRHIEAVVRELPSPEDASAGQKR